MKLARALVALVATAAATASSGQTHWDMSIAWPANNFHTKNAVAFADEVKARTAGRVNITVHPGGELGFKGPESLRAVRDGIVPIAEMNLSQQAGDLPLLSLETLPFLVRSPDELQTLYRHFLPTIEKALTAANQKLLYLVPWPSQMIFTKKPIERIEDLKGVQIRTTDRNNGEMVARLGMSPLTMPYSDLIPALAAGTVQAVQTSAPTAVDFKFWEFMKYALHTNHIWSSNMVTVNLDSWKKVSEADRKLIEQVASDLQPKFWAVSGSADAAGQQTIREHGMEITPVPPAMLQKMEAATHPLWQEFVAKHPAVREPLQQYLQAVGRK